MIGLLKIVTLLSFNFSFSAFAITLDPGAVRAWNKDDKKQFPTPLAAVFKKSEKSLIFVGDHHVDQIKTSRYVEFALNKFKPEIVVVENVDFIEGKNPQQWMDKVIHKSKEELLKDRGANRHTALLAFNNKIPVIGGEPSLEEAMKSSFILSQGFDAEDIQNVQVLQRLPYRRDVIKLDKVDDFFDYAIELYGIKDSRENFRTKFFAWYKKRTSKDFSYSNVTKEESAVNCLPTDTHLQKVACAFNINRDRAIVGNVENLFNSYSRIMVVYGTGHFVQQYPAFRKAFEKEPEYFSIDK
jgi:hypothetical protein